jgi:hypothetical protein
MALKNEIAKNDPLLPVYSVWTIPTTRLFELCSSPASKLEAPSDPLLNLWRQETLVE